MSVKKIENFNIHEQPESNTDSFGVEAYLNVNWEKTKEAVNNNAEELIQSQKDIDANKNDIENINYKNKSQYDTIEALKAENTLIKEQIPSANISGNSIYIEDSSNLNFDWKIRGGHAQTRTTQPENYIDDREARGKTILEATSLYLPIINLKAGSGYYFKIFDSNDKIKNDSRYLAVEFYDINKTKIQSDALGYPNTFSEENANKIKFAKIYYNKNDTDQAIGNTIIKKIGLKITSNVSADDIDMFVPNSPSPGYPSEVETVGSNVNLFDGELESGSLANNTGQNYGNAKNTRSKNYLAVEENTTYALSDNINGSFIVHAYDKDKNWLKMIGASNYTGKYIFTTPTQTAYIRFRTNETDLTAKIKLERDSAITPYSPPGMGCVKKDVVNSNLLDFNVAQNSKATVNEDGTLTINGTGGFSLNIDKLQLKAGITYYQKVELISGSISGSNINNTFLSFTGAGAWISSVNFSQTILNEDTEKTSIWINASTIFNNAVIKIWANTDKSDFVKHQSQTAIMPIQQEMLENDYIADVEHHEWSKLILKGDENWEWNTKKEITQVCQLKFDINIKDGNGYCNYFKYGIAGDVEKFAISQNILFIAINKDRLVEASTSGFKSYLKQQYESGKPVIIYYKLAEPIDLELTSEQKTVREQKLYTYKNITNISLSDELASIDVKYKKDLETEHNKLQNEIDEIKQLLSTTQTSALLLDNMQNDIESEVE